MLNIQGTVIATLPLQSGTSQAGKQWRKQTFVVETADTYPRKVALSLFGDKIDTFLPATGQQVNVTFSLESREYNQRWYTEATAIAVNPVGPVPAVPATPAPVSPVPAAAADDLPF